MSGNSETRCWKTSGILAENEENFTTRKSLNIWVKLACLGLLGFKTIDFVYKSLASFNLWSFISSSMTRTMSRNPGRSQRKTWAKQKFHAREESTRGGKTVQTQETWIMPIVSECWALSSPRYKQILCNITKNCFYVPWYFRRVLDATLLGA